MRCTNPCSNHASLPGSGGWVGATSACTWGGEIRNTEEQNILIAYKNQKTCKGCDQCKDPHFLSYPATLLSS